MFIEIGSVEFMIYKFDIFLSHLIFFIQFLPKKGKVVMKKTIMLKKNYEFKKVLSKGKCFSGHYIIAFVMKNNCQNGNFLGLAISTKVGKAVRRNRIKRLVRESYYFFEEQMHNGFSIVFLWNKHADAQNVSYADIRKDMENILKNAKVL